MAGGLNSARALLARVVPLSRGLRRQPRRERVVANFVRGILKQKNLVGQLHQQLGLINQAERQLSAGKHPRDGTACDFHGVRERTV
jgi:hypothetical protein